MRCTRPEFTAIPSTGIGPGNMMSSVSPVHPFCHYNTGVLTQFRALGVYIVPKIVVQTSTVYQNKPGPRLLANYAVPSAVVAQSLGRPPSGRVPNVTVNLITPGTLYGDRITQLDFRVAKIVSVGRTRTTVGVDLYNALNSNVVLTYNPAFVPGVQWQQPRAVMSPRLIRISGELTF